MLDTKAPDSQLCRSAGVCVFFFLFFFFFFPSSFRVVLEALVKNNRVNLVWEVNVPHSAVPGKASSMLYPEVFTKAASNLGSACTPAVFYGTLGVVRAACRQAEQRCAPTVA